MDSPSHAACRPLAFNPPAEPSGCELPGPKGSALGYTALGADHRAHRVTDRVLLNSEYDHLCPRRDRVDDSVQFPSEAPEKRLIQTRASPKHLDDPRRLEAGAADARRGFSHVLALSSLFFGGNWCKFY